MTAVTASRIPLDTTRPVAIAVTAMGGQGGGVLADWIVALCESQHWAAQSTSVPGVAQRTGATVYFIETLPLPHDVLPGRRPVLSLMAVPGEVDIVIGAELMEAGRAIQRGLVTPDRTTLIASSHRSYAVIEKQVPGDGIGDSEAVYAAAKASARRFIAFDMAEIAEKSGSVISAALFGALAATGALPFPRQAYETVIRTSGVGIEPSLRAFALGFAGATDAMGTPKRVASEPKRFLSLSPIGHAGYDALIEQARRKFPAAAHGMIGSGLQRVVDFQDLAYGAEYLDLLAGLLALDKEAKGHVLTVTAAKYIAVAMAYDDVFRVAELKTRGSRFERLRAEIGVAPDQLVYTTEFMHPRLDEVLGSLPARIGKMFEQRPALVRRLDKFVNRGRRLNTSKLGGFLVLYVLAGLKRFRRATLRHAIELEHRNKWLALVKASAEVDYELAVEVLATRRLVKGYSDTHSRGQSKFERVMSAVKRLSGRPDAADWVRRLREAALRDEDGIALSGVLKTIDSFL